MVDCIRIELQRANRLQIRFDSNSKILVSKFQKVNFRAEKRILKLFIAEDYLEDLIISAEIFLGYC